MMKRFIQGMKVYWILLPVGVGIVVMLVIMSSQSKDITKLEADVETTKELVSDAEKTHSSLGDKFDAEKYQEEVKERTVSAKQIGKEIIAVDDTLTSFYKTNEPLPDDKKKKDALFEKVNDAKAKNSKLTGAKESDHIKTWQLNPEWTLKLESVLTYQDADRVPVVFSMKTKDGKSAGLIYAVYRVKSHTLDNISRHYTTDGLKDEIDVGGV